MCRRASHIFVLLCATLGTIAGCESRHAADVADAVTGADTGSRAGADTAPFGVSFADAAPPAPLPMRAEKTPPPERPRRRVLPLSPEAEAMARLLVFFVTGRPWRTAAVRQHRLLVDIGRVDARVRTPAQRRAFQEAVEAESPLLVGDRLRLHGPWGSTDATVAGFAQVNGRIVATLELPPALDSLARTSDSLVAVAIPADSATAPVVDSCPRDSASTVLAQRLLAVRDSLGARLRADTVRLAEPLRRSLWMGASHAIGCFGPARALLIVALAAGGYDYVRERAVLLDDAGRVTPLRLHPLRFKTHDVLLAFDADGDGVDDIAVRGRGPRVGGTAVLRLDPARRQLDFLTQGFAWEGGGE